jgi:hypothetical protein
VETKNIQTVIKQTHIVTGVVEPVLKVVIVDDKVVTTVNSAKVETLVENRKISFNILAGERGEKGTQGTQGEDGVDGLIGPEGKRGQAGSDATVTKEAVESVLIGVIESHEHLGGGEVEEAPNIPGKTFVRGSTGNSNEWLEHTNDSHRSETIVMPIFGWSQDIQYPDFVSVVVPIVGPLYEDDNSQVDPIITNAIISSAWFALQLTMVERVNDNSIKLYAVNPNTLTFSIVLNIVSRVNLGGTELIFYRHVQGVPSDKWVINHGLNKYPSASITDTSGNVITGDVVHIDKNTLEANFSSSFSGEAYIV